MAKWLRRLLGLPVPSKQEEEAALRLIRGGNGLLLASEELRDQTSIFLLWLEQVSQGALHDTAEKIGWQLRRSRETGVLELSFKCERVGWRYVQHPPHPHRPMWDYDYLCYALAGDERRRLVEYLEELWALRRTGTETIKNVTMQFSEAQ